jgi:PEP-CTERM motif
MTMQLKRLLVNPVSALLLASCAVSPSAIAHADTIAWTNWSSGTSGNPGSATGTIGSINVTYSGQTSGLTNVPSWTPASTFTGGVVGNAPPHTPTIQLEGGSTLTETISFSSTVVDPIFAIWSLGAPGNAASFDFSSKSGQPFSILGGGPSAEFGGSALTSTGSVVHGSEGNGLVQFMGSFDSISFTTPNFENYYAFTVGYDATLTPTPPSSVPEPATLSLFGLGLAAIPLVRRSLSRVRS